MYTLKSIARRGTSFGAAFALLVAAIAPAVLPAVSAYADALNPLTERSLTLSTSAPGWDNTDGSGNAMYAPPNSGANGEKAGNTFSFKVSSDTSTGNKIQGFTFQYCVSPAGTCSAPGNNSPITSANNATTRAAHTADLDVVGNTWAEYAGTYANNFDSTTGNVTKIPTVDTSSTPPNAPVINSNGQYIVEYNNAGTWTQSTGWTMKTADLENGVANTTHNNLIALYATGSNGLAIPAGTQVRVVFFAAANDYITNPGAGEFFVKINDYAKSGGITGQSDLYDPTFTAPNTSGIIDANVVDGGVTVANVMNLSIEIQTKVLETMSFSVGTVDPDTLSSTAGSGVATGTVGTPAGPGTGVAATDSQFYDATGSPNHSICDPIAQGMISSTYAGSDARNTLLLGDENTEHALSVDHTYSTHSYFRLSSNASAGATVYYAGETLSNTEGDQIAAMDTTHNSGGTVSAAPTKGKEQFGLALDNGSSGTYAVNYAEERDGSTGKGVYESGADNTAAGIVALNPVNPNPGTGGVAPSGTGIDPSTVTDNSGSVWKTPQLQINADGTPLLPKTNYGGGTGVVNSGYGTVNTQFAFNSSSNLVPIPIAEESAHVVDCATGKVRYIANIAATTPAGIYTTKVNYIAAPQY